MLTGVLTGAIILVMALTGALITFEKPLIAWLEGSVRKTERAVGLSEGKTVDHLFDRLRFEYGRNPLAVTIFADPHLAVEVVMGREEVLFWDPSSDQIRPSRTTWLRHLMSQLTAWHRWLGLDGQRRNWGKAITGACNVAFLGLIITGLILWWPARLGPNVWRLRLWFRRGMKAHARDWHWHHVIGFWCGPVLLVLSGSAIVISYAWASQWVERIGGRAVAARSELTSGASLPEIGSPTMTSTTPLSLQESLDIVQRLVPTWQSLTIRVGGKRPDPGPDLLPRSERLKSNHLPKHQRFSTLPSPGSPDEHRPGVASQVFGKSADSVVGENVTIAVRERGTWPLFATTQIRLDPRSGLIISRQSFSDLPLGRRIRMWLRYLHTGEALGWPGQLLAMIASLGAVVLVWTGLTLSCRRFLSSRGSTRLSSLQHPTHRQSTPTLQAGDKQ